MIFLRYILFPFVPVYYFITWLRNLFFDFGFFDSKSYGFPVICVGNLSVGGTGKTPMIEYLIRLLKDEKRLATLSRGYKRSTTGFYLANSDATANDLGDEPLQFYKKFGSSIQVAVDANRQNGIGKLMQTEKVPEVVLLDDAFQHRKVKAGFYILLTTYANLYVNDWVLPTGNLREPRTGAKRANIIVVTKCPENLLDLEKNKIIARINPKPYQTVYFSSIRYATKVFSEEKELELPQLKAFTLVTGIAKPEPLVAYLKDLGLKFEHLNYKDHYTFTAKDIKLFKQKELLITTEKDYMRLLPYSELKSKIFYLPIEIALDNAMRFDKQIQDFVNSK